MTGLRMVILKQEKKMKTYKRFYWDRREPDEWLFDYFMKQEDKLGLFMNICDFIDDIEYRYKDEMIEDGYLIEVENETNI